jgi:hypothetical protein
VEGRKKGICYKEDKIKKKQYIWLSRGRSRDLAKQGVLATARRGETSSLHPLLIKHISLQATSLLKEDSATVQVNNKLKCLMFSFIVFFALFYYWYYNDIDFYSY